MSQKLTWDAGKKSHLMGRNWFVGLFVGWLVHNRADSFGVREKRGVVKSISSS